VGLASVSLLPTVPRLRERKPWAGYPQDFALASRQDVLVAQPIVASGFSTVN
jgi:hypothetical protein